MPIYKLKNKRYSIKTNKPIQYVNGKWLADGKRIGSWTLGQIQFKDSDGYYKTPLPNGGLAVQDVDNNGNPIKHVFIGSNTKISKKGTPGRQNIIDKVNNETAEKYWKQAPIIRHAVDSIAERYNINPKLLRDRLNKEGFTQKSIKINNEKEDSNSYKALNTNYPWYGENNNLSSPGFIGFGLDDVADFINQGKVKLINENWTDSYNINEHNREVHSADGLSNADNIGITAATLKYFRDKAAKDFPKASRTFLDEAAGMYYNRGEQGGKTYMKKKYNK